MPYRKALKSLVASTIMIATALSPIHALTPQETFAQGCGRCHTSERKILRRIPPGPDLARRTWIETFMAGHHNESATLKAEILDYLVERSAPSKKWWQP